jgi:hypothetical protein
MKPINGYFESLYKSLYYKSLIELNTADFFGLKNK